MQDVFCISDLGPNGDFKVALILMRDGMIMRLSLTEEQADRLKETIANAQASIYFARERMQTETKKDYK